jgi:serine phosphatase RsbU (regulator of sigma subunit)
MTSAVARARSLLIGLVGAASLVVAIGFHVLAWNAGRPVGGLLQGVFHALTFVGLGSLWIYLRGLVEQRRPGPARSFWSLSLVAAGAAALTFLALLVARPPAEAQLPASVLMGFDLDTGAPIVLATVLKMSALAAIQGAFAVYLLVRLRGLVLVKRSRSSVRNWKIMVVLMVIAAVAVGGSPPEAEMNEIQTILLICAIVFMLVNAFRLSWIVSLSFRQKMATAGLSLILLVILSVGQGVMSGGAPESGIVAGYQGYVQHFSMPLALFSTQASIFGILYCLTTMLSLLFHLPTSGEFQQRAGERAAMHALTHSVGGVFDPDRLHAAIAGSPVEAGSAHAAWLSIADPDSGSLRPRVVAAHGVDIDRIELLVDHEALYADLLARRVPLVLDHALADHRIRARPGDGVDSLVVAPLLARDRMVGALFACKQVEMGFEKDEVETIAILAGQAALAIENARLFEQQVEKERLARELAIAREVQRRLLPQEIPVLDGISMAASSVSAQEVGGDYYDFVRLGANRLGIIIADVSGKGTSAAFYMAEMQGIFQAVSRLAPSPAEFLYHANVAISESLERNTFVSAVYGVLDVEAETLVLARAGHCPVAVVTVSGEGSYLRSGGLGLGLDRGETFRDSVVEIDLRLAPGDVYALYTDGVVETRNRDGEEFGYDRLLRVLTANRHEEAGTVHAAVIDELTRFAEGLEYGDDMTLVILKWHGLPTASVTSGEIVAERAGYA